MTNNPEIIAIVGPTACGKTQRAVALAKEIDGEIISGDSRQIYVGMSIGTGKDLCEYGSVPYHLIDIRPAGYKYNLYEYLADFDRCRQDISERGKMPILCGGTGMYVESALSGIRLPNVPCNEELRSALSGKSLDELIEILKKKKKLHNTTDIDTVKRAIRAIEIEQYYDDNPQSKETATRSCTEPLNALIIGIQIPVEDRRKRITQRLYARFEEGMIDEVCGLLDSGISPEDLIYYGLEYKYITRYIIGEISKDEMIKGLEIAIHQFAKRQMTWFRGMERRGFNINWLSYDISNDKFINEVNGLIKNNSKYVNNSKLR